MLRDPEAAGARHVLIVNQHGDNRGDEAAMLAMLDALAARLQPVEFTVLHQFNDPVDSAKDGGHSVRFIALAPGVVALARMFGAVGLRAIRLPWRALAGAFGREVIDAYVSADLVVCAPGGPYFGDIYADHEPLHWAYVLMARTFDRPVFLYAPSVGPFRKRGMQRARRFVFRRFTGVTVREPRSAEYLRSLFGREPFAVEVTIDAALGAEISPLPRAEWPGALAPADATKLIAVSVIDYKYPDASEPDAARARHDDAVVEALARASERLAPAHVVFMPQVHGRRRDQPYLERLASRLPAEISHEVLAEHVPSRTQQRIFASAELVLAGRYHPAVFSVLGAVPVACIAYEHKSTGLMDTAGLGPLVLPIDEVTTERLCSLVDTAIDDAEKIRTRLREARTPLRQLALRTADLAVETMVTTSTSEPRARTTGRPPPLTPMAWLRWDAVRRALSETQPERILEIGAGEGAMGWRLAHRAEYVGVEPDETSCAVARERLASCEAAGVRHGDIDAVPSDEHFDLVCAFEVLEHIDDDAGALAAWRQRVAPTGHLLISVPGDPARFGPSDEAVGHFRRYERVALEQLLTDAGFRVVWVRGYGAGLGHVLEAGRNRILERRPATDREAGTARSGRLYQPPDAAGSAVAVAVAPFRGLQSYWSARGRGVGYVVLAERVD